MKFIEHKFPQNKRLCQIDAWAEFINNLEIRKSIIDLRASGEFDDSYVRKNLETLPILSTVGYSDTFLKFVS